MRRCKNVWFGILSVKQLIIVQERSDTLSIFEVYPRSCSVRRSWNQGLDYRLFNDVP